MDETRSNTCILSSKSVSIRRFTSTDTIPYCMHGEKPQGTIVDELCIKCLFSVSRNVNTMNAQLVLLYYYLCTFI